MLRTLAGGTTIPRALCALCALSLCLIACGDSDPAPSVQRMCEQLEALCGEELGFTAGQCEALAEEDPPPSAQERRCVVAADDCVDAMACVDVADGGIADAGE